jgi:dihydroceramidase
MSLSLITLGINSALFHGTLRHGSQFADELSMFLLAGSLLQPLLTVGQLPVVSALITGTISLAIVVSSILYIRSADIIFHSIIFVAMLTMIWPRTLILIYSRGRSAEEKRGLIRRFWKSLILLVVAYMAWNLDLEKCLELRQFRASLGAPWAWLFEFHGWWHILTAAGASQYVRLIRELCKS